MKTSLTTEETFTLNIIGNAPTSTITNFPINRPLPKAIRNDTFSLTVHFSEPITGFDSSDIKITNGSLLSSPITLVKDQIFQINILSNSQNNISIEIPADVVMDPIGLGNTASNIVTIRYDITRPSITTRNIPSFATQSAFTAHFIFDEEVFWLHH